MPEDVVDPRDTEQSGEAEPYLEGHATTFGGAMAGALTGAVLGGSTIGPAGAAIGAAAGGAIGAAAERTMHVDDDAEQGTLGETTWVAPSVEESADRTAYLASRGVPMPAPEGEGADEFQRDDM